jgi:hypothetical protein
MPFLTVEMWRSKTGDIEIDDKSTSLMELVLERIQVMFDETPDVLDIPILDVPLDGFDHAMTLPFEVRTWDLLSDASVSSDLELGVLLTGTFRELVERVGELRAAVDVAVTGAAWIRPRGDGRFGFVVCKLPDTLKKAQRLAAIRSFRSRGLSPESSFYSPKPAAILGNRWGVGLAKRWTLEKCGEMLDLTRERVRQIEKKPMWEPNTRQWLLSPILNELHEAVMSDLAASSYSVSSGEIISRDDAVALLVEYGCPAEDFAGPWSVADELKLLGYKFSDVRRVAYVSSERLGFVTREDLVASLRDGFPEIVGDIFDELCQALIVVDGLPHGYVYVEGSEGSYFRGWIRSLLAVRGPITVGELYAAVKRACQVRVPGLVFPPRSVIEAFLAVDSDVWCDDGVVGLATPFEHSLGRVEQWVYDTISASTGQVIHRTELWEQARAAGVKGGTLNVYSTYSIYFKLCGRGCITLTGLFPGDVALDLASRRAAAIRVPTIRESVEVRGRQVVVVLQVGNDLLDSGVFHTTREIRQMTKGVRFASMADGRQFGFIGWSGTAMTGFNQSLQYMKVQPGDQVSLTFSISDHEVHIDLVSSDRDLD